MEYPKYGKKLTGAVRVSAFCEPLLRETHDLEYLGELNVCGHMCCHVSDVGMPCDRATDYCAAVLVGERQRNVEDIQVAQTLRKLLTSYLVLICSPCFMNPCGNEHTAGISTPSLDGACEWGIQTL